MVIWYDRAIVPMWSPVIDRAKFTALKKESGKFTWDEMQQTEKCTDQEGEKSHGAGKH